jgi:hypothetical protein
MPRLPRPDDSDPSPARLGLSPARVQSDRIARISAGWAFDDPRWNDLKDLLAEHAGDIRKYEADRIRKHADDPKVKPNLLEGEWTGLRMAANLLHLEKD